MTTFITNTTSWIKRHKILTAFMVAVLAIVVWRIVHAMNNTTGEPTYVLGTVEKGTIVASVSGTGQVSASNQVDLSPKTSGELIYLNAKVGQYVSQGTLLAQVDSSNAAYDVETAKLSYQKLTTVDPEDLQNATDAVTSASLSAQSALTATLTDMSNNMEDINGLLDGYIATVSTHGLNASESSYVNRAEASYAAADTLLDAYRRKYLSVSSSTSSSDLVTILDSASKTAVAIAEAAKDTKDTISYLRDQDENNKDATAANDAYTSATSITASANASVSQLLSAKTTLQNNIQALADLKDGPDVLDVRSAEASLKAKQEAYADTMVRAPFAGVIAAVPVTLHDNISASTTVATLITKQKVAELSLNEIDAAKVQAGDKATLTFDAIDGLTITGEVLTVDLVGTVSQGVVSYDVKIGFDTDDDRVKPGMTVSANIITATAADVLLVPASAITTKGDTSTVMVVPDAEVPADASATGVVLATKPESVTVTTGLSDDTNTEITSGLAEGQHIVVRTVTKSATATAAAPSLIGGGNTRAAGGGNAQFRGGGRFGG